MGPERVEILKFGGTSVASREAVSNSAYVTSLHKTDQVGIVSIVSARKGTTDGLQDAVHFARDPQGDFRGAINTIGHDHMMIVNELPTSHDVNIVRLLIEKEIQNIETILETIRISGEELPSLSDRVLSAGERMNAPIVASIMREQGMKAKEIPAEDVIATNGRYKNAAMDLAATKQRVKTVILPELAEGNVVVLGGFYGADAGDRRKITTFGRGGSDLSATALAEAMNSYLPVEDIFLYKADVAGVLSADPGIVAAAHKNDHMTYDEIKALSGIGGKVVHSRAVYHAENIGANLHIKSTLSPRDPGTLVDGQVDPGVPVKAVTFLDNMPWIRIEGSGMDQPGIISRLADAIAATGQDIKFITQPLSEQTVDIALGSGENPQEIEHSLNTTLRPYIVAGDIEPVSVETVAAVGVIGHGVDYPDVKEKIYHGMRGSEEYPVDPMPGKESGGANEVSILINNTDGVNAPNAVRSIHGVIFPKE